MSHLRRLITSLTLLGLLGIFAASLKQEEFVSATPQPQQTIPRTWDEAALA